MINTTSESLKARQVFIFQHFYFNAQLEKHFITLGPCAQEYKNLS